MNDDAFGRIDWFKRALGDVPPLIMHMRVQAFPSMQAAGEPRVSGSKEQTIAPLNIVPLDDADELWAIVCALAVDHAERTGVVPPRVLARQWIEEGSVRRVRGFASSNWNQVYGDVAAVVQHLTAHAWTLSINQEYSVPVDELVKHISGARRRYAGAPSFSGHSARHRCPKCLQYGVVPEYSDSGEIQQLRCERCGATRKF